MENLPSSEVRNEYTRTGKLRTLIHLGNRILARWDQIKGIPYGVSVDFATVLASRLNEGLEIAAGVKQQLDADAQKTKGLIPIPR